MFGNLLSLSVKVHLLYAASRPCDLLLQIEAAPGDDQEIVDAKLTIASTPKVRRVAGEDGIGQRIWLKTEGDFECHYQASIQTHRPPVHLKSLRRSPLSAIPGDVIKYLMPSRYCLPDDFSEFVSANFEQRVGGELVSEMSAWVDKNFVYDNAASDALTTAKDSFDSRSGVCRDYAHVLIAMVRAAGIPARMVSAYAPDVRPQDFHAVVEVYLAGAWHLVDPTGMARAEEIVRVGVGRDAADISFMTSFGRMDMKAQSVEVIRTH